MTKGSSTSSEKPLFMAKKEPNIKSYLKIEKLQKTYNIRIENNPSCVIITSLLNVDSQM